MPSAENGCCVHENEGGGENEKNEDEGHETKSSVSCDNEKGEKNVSLEGENEEEIEKEGEMHVAEEEKEGVKEEEEQEGEIEEVRRVSLIEEGEKEARGEEEEDGEQTVNEVFEPVMSDGAETEEYEEEQKEEGEEEEEEEGEGEEEEEGHHEEQEEEEDAEMKEEDENDSEEDESLISIVLSRNSPSFGRQILNRFFLQNSESGLVEGVVRKKRKSKGASDSRAVNAEMRKRLEDSNFLESDYFQNLARDFAASEGTLRLGRRKLGGSEFPYFVRTGSSCETGSGKSGSKINGSMKPDQGAADSSTNSERRGKGVEKPEKEKRRGFLSSYGLLGGRTSSGRYSRKLKEENESGGKSEDFPEKSEKGEEKRSDSKNESPSCSKRSQAKDSTNRSSYRFGFKTGSGVEREKSKDGNSKPLDPNLEQTKGHDSGQNADPDLAKGPNAGQESKEEGTDNAAESSIEDPTSHVLRNLRIGSSGMRAKVNIPTFLESREINASGRGCFSRPERLHISQHFALPSSPPLLVDERRGSRAYGGKFGRDGQFFVASFQDRVIRVYDVCNNWSLRKEVIAKNLQWTITDTDISPDNRFLLYSTINPYIHLVDLSSRNGGVTSLQNITDVHDELDLSSFARADSLAPHEPIPLRRGLRHYTPSFGIWAAKFSSDGREIVAGTSDNSIYIFDVERRKSVVRIRGHKDDVNAICFLDDSSQLIVSGSDDKLCKVWDRRLLPSDSSIDAASDSSSPAVDISTGSTNNTANNSRGLHCPASSSRQLSSPVGVFVGHLEGITHIDAKGDGRHFVSNSKDQSIKLWDLRKMKGAKEFESLPPYRSPSLGWDYRWMPYPRCNESLIHPYDHCIRTFKGHKVLQTLIRAYFSPAHSTGQRYIYTGSHDGCIYIYDSLTGELVRKLASFHSDVVREAHWSPDGAFRMASVSWDGRVALWESARGSELNPDYDPGRIFKSRPPVTATRRNVDRFTALWGRGVSDDEDDDEMGDDVQQHGRWRSIRTGRAE